MVRRSLSALGVAVVVSAGAVGCSNDTDEATTVLDVYAAASLKQAFTEIADEYARVHEDVDVRVNFAGSSALVTQIEQGATADVIATADEKTMARLGATAVDPEIFATNTLVIVTGPGNPENIVDLASLTNPELSTVVCAVEVPCGAATAQVEKNTGIDLEPVSEESSVSAVVAKVTSGQADAGIVYVTDARGAGDKVSAVTDPAFAEVVNAYPIAKVKGSPRQQDAQMFVDLVLGETGAAVLRADGFSPAPA
ncbi:molybdate ABC transporter substrate-binding protein [Gordonia sp. PKS22-38]|uniref:Molybdate ABC transporter substrate-binding protein n=1 Tax=Gordonia prachuapensis TaxID=3115651 RepID=A0ABU7MQY5_9ACTN|nr:molybdate ABC transporter substrate-binding protein [Gordonia sp. PKS22-38]